MATQTIVRIPRTWKSFKKYFLEVTEWEFCDDLWRVIKEFAFERPEIIQAIQMVLNRTFNLEWCLLPDNFQLKLAKCEDLDFMDLCEDNRWRKKCLQVCEDKLKLAKRDIKDIKKYRDTYIKRAEKFTETQRKIAEDGQSRTEYFHTCYAKKLLKVCNHEGFYCGCIHKMRDLEGKQAKVIQAKEDFLQQQHKRLISHYFSLLPFHLDL